ncbi:MAG: dihydropteroate synthase [Gammaproteobacteria bacterium]|nr:dihydropteroate synthase [Gammaproteobacteria bacterium]
MILDCAGKPLDLSRPRIMGILNVTPDSFSDGGDFISPGVAISHAEQMLLDGADIIDIGGESTRPGADAVSEQEELDRVIPVIDAITSRLSTIVSIDTSKPVVMREAVAAGAGLINDVLALQAPGAVMAAQELAVPVCLMHMQGRPRTMQKDPAYDDVVADISEFFRQRVANCLSAGILRERLILDPGFGFGKTLEHNLTLLAALGKFGELGLPLLVGISRKSMIGAILNDAPADKRLYGSVAAAILAMERGASILRVHDVKPTVDALGVFNAVKYGAGG